ncbi:zinc-ribbon domain-containing protein [Oceanobacillus massiliensis]|uniref:zinc-ribbon domain-containing protein n=1 Tax=Oceanobacillus massiliensis TaxID=1465765 RepID=UPI0002886E05|nr:zinc-ribbon domain-containing protein [Oceanobacillus massiliensis]
MFHCPYCGTDVKEDEQYCIHCGKKLPKDIKNRIYNRKKFNKFWYMPLISAVIIAVSTGLFHLILENESIEAKELYSQGEQKLQERNYQQAKELFSEALDHNHNFSIAENTIEFVNAAIEVQKALDQAKQLQEDKKFQEATSLINNASSLLKNYEGSAADLIISDIGEVKNNIKITELKYTLNQKPKIEDLKVMLWEAEAINSQEADTITDNIRNQIVDYSFSRASEQLNQKQFNDAQIIVEDGKKYAPQSEKLLSLETTITKEKSAFETAQQQRIEQAINSAQEEQNVNENDAIKLKSADLEIDDQGNIVAKGQVESVATVPISSVVVEYSILTNKDTEVLSNEVVIFPETLYPDENGRFEFTHFDLKRDLKELDIEVNKITWYTE